MSFPANYQPDHKDDGVRAPGFKGRKWEPAAMLIAMGWTSKATAEKVGVSQQTMVRWRRHSQFKAFVNRVHDECIEQAIGKLADAMTKAADVVLSLLESSNENMRLAASDRVKDWIKHFRNDRLVLEKLEQLEAKLPTLPTTVPVTE